MIGSTTKTQRHQKESGGGHRIGSKVALCLGVLVVVFCTVHVARWGRPVPLAWQAAGAHRWVNTAGERLEALDLDGDGSWDRFNLNDSFFLRPQPATPVARRLAICLDGVPYSIIRDLWSQGRFREFFPPVEVVSTFPSESEVAMTALLHAAPAPGYENRHFDWKHGEVAGGVAVTLAQSAPYLKKLDYDEPGLFKGLHFIMPAKSFRADLGRLRKRFLASSVLAFVAHISSTDALCHVMRAEQLAPLLIEVDEALRDLCFSERGRLRLLLFSDHGNNLVPSRPAPLRASLERAGFRVRNRLDEPRAVALPEFGLVSFAALYCRPELVRELAGVLAATEGVELAVYRDGERVAVRSSGGAALIEANTDGTRFLYRPLKGDPLLLLPVWEQLRAAGKLDAQGSAAEADLFAATLSARYPDALFRLWEWGRSPYVEDAASVMVSLADGYSSGSGIFQRMVTLQSTHGSLARRCTLGFAMTTDGPLPRALRVQEVMSYELRVKN
jgi:hypothetical protein